MTEPAPENRAFYWSALFFRELYAAGLRHAVLSPGSRCTPISLAAASHPGIQKHVILDERSAAFTALGIGKSSGRPAVLICTSGTAAANYFPAVVEARQSGVPLLIATADRPPAQRNTGANQTIDQIKLFGDYPVFFHEVGEAVFEQQDLQRLQMLADQSVDIAMSNQGPVHLNFPFRKPLEPNSDFIKKIHAETKSLMEEAIPAACSFPSRSSDWPQQIKELIANSKRPLIIQGPMPASAETDIIKQLAHKLEAPVLTEGAGPGDHCIQYFDGFLRNPENRSALKPDLILRFGFQPTAKAIELCLKEWRDLHHIHFAPDSRWQDATFSTSHRLNFMPLNADLATTVTEKGWLNLWKKAEASFGHKLTTKIEKEKELTDGHVHYYLSRQIPENCFLFLSNSFPVRDCLLFGRGPASINRFVNRGASGIDGITSTAIGTSIGSDKPGILFTGDLAFLHDSNALLSSKLLRKPLVVVIINNAGGSIFRMLPIATNKTYFNTYFETPQQADISKLAQAYNLGYTLIKDLETLKRVDLTQQIKSATPGLHIIECQTNADASMNLRRTLWGEQQ